MKEIKYSSLFSPIKVNNLMIKNRIIAAPMGIPKAQLLSSTYYGGISLPDKAKGGSGAIVVNELGLSSISKTGSAFDKYARDVTRETLSLLEGDGAVGVIEFGFHPIENDDGTIQAPSDGIAYNNKIAKEMTIEQMHNQINKLCIECKNAKDFGFRMIMLHFGHDSQCGIFLSPTWNKRKDQYGGSLENRIRFAKEALEAVRNTVGNNFPLMIRVSRSLVIKETYDEDDMFYFLSEVKDLVDLVNISAGMDCYGGNVDNYQGNVFAHTTIFEPRFLNLNFAERVKKELGIKVCLVGGISDPKFCNYLIENDYVDMVMLGRQLVADPFWPNKALDGKDDEIVPCLRFLNCYHIATEHANIQCSVNPRFRRENRVPLHLTKTNNPLNVIVVGGGPAGMKAALTASEKGHRITLIEKNSILGGQLNYAKLGKYKNDIGLYNDYLIKHINKSNVNVLLNTSATRQLLMDLNPDRLILAIGGNFIFPNIPGVELAYQAIKAYENGLDNISGKAIVIGGGTIGSELALELAEDNKEVVIVEMGDKLCAKGNKLYRIALNQHIKKCESMKVYLNSKVTKIDKNGVYLVNEFGEEVFESADNIYLSVGIRSSTKEAEELYLPGVDTRVIGDLKNVASIIEATNDGYFAGEIE